MKRLLLILLMLTPLTARGQWQGSLAPYLEGTFFDNAGLPIFSGYICTTVTGTTTNLSTYPTKADADAGTNPNANPITLDSAGRSNMWLGTGTYRVVIYRTGSGNTCNGTTVGTAIKTVDGVQGLGALLVANSSFTGNNTFTGLSTFTSLNNRKFCVTGATMGAKFVAAAAALPSTGGIVDCSGLQGAQAISSDVFTAITKPITLIWPSGTVTASVSVTVPSNIALDFSQGGILSMNTSTTATINGTVDGSWSNHFAGAGTVLLNGAQGDVPVQWFGALGDGSTSDSAAIQKAVTALTGKGGTLFFSHSGRYPITSTVTISSLRPIHLKCDMFGHSFLANTQGNGAILLGGTIAGPMFKYTAPDSGARDSSGGGSVEGCSFQDGSVLSGRNYTTTAVLDLHDFLLSQVHNNLFQLIKGSAILGEFLVQSEISGNIIRYCGNTSKPAIDLQNNSAGVYVAQSLKIEGNRLEVNYLAPYVKLAATLFDISLIDNRFEADTAVADTNQSFINAASFYTRILGNMFNRNTGNQVTLSGAGNNIVGNNFRGGAYSPTALILSGGRQTVTGNVFESLHTGYEVSMNGSTTFTGNEMYFAGCLLVEGATGNTITGNIMQDLTCTTAVLGAGADYWIDLQTQSNTVTGNVLTNFGANTTTVGGIQVGSAFNNVTGNTVKYFNGTGNGAKGINVATNSAIVANNTTSAAPIVLANYDSAMGLNFTDGTVPQEATQTHSFGSILDGGYANTTVTFTGVVGGDIIDATFGPMTAGHHLQAIAGSGQVVVTLFNDTGSTADLGSGTVFLRRRKW